MPKKKRAAATKPVVAKKPASRSGPSGWKRWRTKAAKSALVAVAQTAEAAPLLEKEPETVADKEPEKASEEDTESKKQPELETAEIQTDLTFHPDSIISIRRLDPEAAATTPPHRIRRSASPKAQPARSRIDPNILRPRQTYPQPWLRR